MSARQMRIVCGFAAGVLFGLGLVISGMADPAKVMNFLDLGGRWDPSLAFVMAGAIAVTFTGYRIAFGRGRPRYDSSFHVPAADKIDRTLLIGAAIFGIGWGLAGFCPGPAITSLALFAPGTLVFVAAMSAGMWIGRIAPRLT